jgi:hypothetical protein
MHFLMGSRETKIVSPEGTVAASDDHRHSSQKGERDPGYESSLEGKRIGTHTSPNYKEIAVNGFTRREFREFIVF